MLKKINKVTHTHFTTVLIHRLTGAKKPMDWGRKAGERSGDQSSVMHGGEGSLAMTQSVNQSQDQYL